MKIIVGLGNPGKEYKNTRHNVGFRVVEQIFNLKFLIFNQFLNFKFEKRLESELVEGEIGGEKVLLLKPQTYMNRSGEAVSGIANFYKVSFEDLIIVHDDFDLPLGRIRIQKGGGSAGHHGIESIIKIIGSDNFVRFRVGIRTKEGEALSFVLTPFGKEEQKIFEKVIEKTAEAVLFALKEGIEKAMTKYNTK